MCTKGVLWRYPIVIATPKYWQQIASKPEDGFIATTIVG